VWQPVEENDMLAQAPPLAAREIRFPVQKGKSIKVTIERRDGPPLQEIEGEVIDISRAGVKLSVSSCPGMQEAVVLNVLVPEIDLELSIDATVCWSRPGPGETWYLGCVLHPPLPDKVLTDLAIQGYLQRRRDPRHSIDLAATMWCEGILESARVRLADYSTGGIRILSPRAATAGQRLRLQFDEGCGPGDQIVAKTAWQFKRSDGYEIGCAFVSKNSYQVFRDLLPPSDTKAVAKPTSRPRLPHPRWLALAAAVAIAALSCALLL
jgi:hypothetical protein